MKKLSVLLTAIVLCAGLWGCAAGNAGVDADSESGAQSRNETTETAGIESDVTISETTASSAESTVKPAVATARTTTEAPVSETQSEIRVNEPVDIINDVPLYIEFEADYAIQNYPDKRGLYHCDLEGANESVIISYDGFFGILDVRAYEIFYEDHNDKSAYWLGEELFDIWGVSDKFAVDYKTRLSEYTPDRVIVLIDYDANAHSYMLSKNKDGTLKVEKVDIHKRKRGNDGVKHTFGGKEEIAVNFYNINDVGDYYENGKLNAAKMPYTTDTVSIENFAEDMQEKMFLHTGIRVDDIWYEGTKLYVDLNVYEKYNFDRGSTAGTTLSAELKQTLRSLPGIEKIEILLDGERGVESDHFSFGEFEVE